MRVVIRIKYMTTQDYFSVKIYQIILLAASIKKSRGLERGIFILVLSQRFSNDILHAATYWCVECFPTLAYILNFVVSYCQVWKRKIFGAPLISYSRETIGFSDVSRISNCPRPQNSRLQSSHQLPEKFKMAVKENTFHASISGPLY